MLKLLRHLRGLFLDLLFPIECLNCRLEGAYLCSSCFQKLKLNDEDETKEVGLKLKISNLTKIFIAGDYENSILHNLIIKFKYNFLSALGKTLARFLIIFWQKEISRLNFIKNENQAILVIPIPLAKSRLRWRGFNQAEILARDFSAYFDYELSLDLKRLKATRPQATLNEIERFKNIKSVFAWQGKNLANFTIILIDDVTTTGATLNEAALILKKSGAKIIYGLVLAKG